MEVTMTKPAVLIATVAVVALPIAALAQTPNSSVQYCNELADTYTRYIGHDSDNARRLGDQGSVEGLLAAAQCREGNTADAIPVLERILRNNGFTLPPRG
jgi:hypothetical protein